MTARVFAAEQLTCTDHSSSVRVSAGFEPNTFNVLVGETGSGKNRFLRQLGLLEMPGDGDVWVEGESTRSLDAEARATLRNRRFGFLFAQPFLLPSFSAVENIAMPLFKIAGVTSEEARPRVHTLLELVGLAKLEHIAVQNFSIFDQQRIALARALINEPDFLLAESVDAALAGDELAAFGALLRRAISECGVTLVATASTLALTPFADRVIEFAHGRIVRDSHPAAFGGATA